MEKRLMLIKEEAAVLERKNGEMACEVERLSKENAELKRMLATATKAEEFVEEFGAAFKRKPDGNLPRRCLLSDPPHSGQLDGRWGAILLQRS
jgi:hypothetical protein